MPSAQEPPQPPTRLPYPAGGRPCPGTVSRGANSGTARGDIRPAWPSSSGSSSPGWRTVGATTWFRAPFRTTTIRPRSYARRPSPSTPAGRTTWQAIRSLHWACCRLSRLFEEENLSLSMLTARRSSLAATLLCLQESASHWLAIKVFYHCLNMCYIDEVMNNEIWGSTYNLACLVHIPFSVLYKHELMNPIPTRPGGTLLFLVIGWYGASYPMASSCPSYIFLVRIILENVFLPFSDTRILVRCYSASIAVTIRSRPRSRYSLV